MSKALKIWLSTAASLILAGVLVFVTALYIADFDITKLSTEKYETKTYYINDSFQNISIDAEISDITVLPSKTQECKVEFWQTEKTEHYATVKNNTLSVEVRDYEYSVYIGISFTSPKVSIYLPENEYSALSVNTETGKVSLSDLAFTTLSVKSSTGNVNLDTVVAKENISLESDTGNIKLSSVDSKSLTVKTDTGNVKGSLLSEKKFNAKSDTGNVKVPKSKGNENCKITSDTGNINIKIE